MYTLSQTAVSNHFRGTAGILLQLAYLIKYVFWYRVFPENGSSATCVP